MHSLNISLKPVAFLCVIALSIFTGCDALDTETDLPESSTSSDEVQIDYSTVGPEAQAVLLSESPTGDGPDREALQSFGFNLFGAVFTMSNAPEGNDIHAFFRNFDGRLIPGGVYSAEGLGTGDGLNGTSNPMALAFRNRYLLAVNGGSNEISVFRVYGAELTYVGKVSSGGTRPISITVHRRWVYVLNAGHEEIPGNIAGFSLSRDGELTPIPGGRQPLHEDALGVSQIDFNPSGSRLVITDKPTNTITTYYVSEHGVAGRPHPNPANGQTTFGFDFDWRGRLIVSEASGGAEDASTVSSYDLLNNGQVNAITESIPTTETAACWIETFGPFAYSTNTGSSSVTGFAIQPDGSLERLNDDGVTVNTGEGSRPLDMDVALWFLYVHSAGTNRLSVYRIGYDGSLTSVPNGAASGLPETAVGVAAY